MPLCRIFGNNAEDTATLYAWFKLKQDEDARSGNRHERIEKVWAPEDKSFVVLGRSLARIDRLVKQHEENSLGLRAIVQVENPELRLP